MRFSSIHGTAAVLVFLSGGLALSDSARGVNIILDYSYDTTNFFNASGNPQGALGASQATASLEKAATFFSGLITDPLSAISTPSPLTSSLPPLSDPGTFTWTWSANFIHPATGATTILTDPTVAGDVYRIYVGGRPLSGSTAGKGGPGGFAYSFGTTSGTFYTPDEITQINATSDAFVTAVTTRGKPSGFQSWGGAIGFDNDGSTTWYFDSTTPPSSGTLDFYSVALHEMGHALGLGTASQWTDQVFTSGPNSFFTGPAAQADQGGAVLLSSDQAHWAVGTTSAIFGTLVTQEAAMSPSITDGSRKVFTHLDVAGLSDIGWTVPEPASLLILALGGLLVTGRRGA